MALADRFYQRSPRVVQTLLLNAYAWRIQRTRFGRDFRSLLDQWETSQWWDADRMREFQDGRLRDIVAYAAAHVPFYARLWAEHGVNPKQVQGVADLPRLPLVCKEDVRRAGQHLLATPRPGRLTHGHTSGTTGSPLSLYYDRAMVVVSNAADWRQKRWAGLQPGTWCGLLLGRVTVPPDQRRPPFWRVNFVQRQVWFSAFHLSDANLPAYTAEIRGRRLRFLEGYPSTLFILARHVLKCGERLPMEAVLTSSETLHSVQREAIETAFDCPVFDFYGAAERVIFAGSCAEGRRKHLFEEYGVTEYVGADDAPVPDGRSGTMVGTTLWNRGMPLIRYRTSDVSIRATTPCTCGRGLPMLSDVATKAEDVVVTPDGRFISPSVLTHPFKPFDQILKSQIVQDAPDHLDIAIVPLAAFSDAQRDALVAGVRERVGERMRIDTRLVDDIPRDASGKFRWVVCRVPHALSINWGEGGS
jgi:phenylacetate-CoA ligase